MDHSEHANTGKAIASAIGTTLTKSGMLDHLVDRGKVPDYECVYIYNHHYVWKKDAPFFEARQDVKEGQRRVHKVRPGERGVGYEFEFADEPGVTYCVNYGWALVPDTPENVKALDHYREAQRQIRLEQLRLSALLESISLQANGGFEATEG